jgi:hypothetical protein
MIRFAAILSLALAASSQAGITVHAEASGSTSPGTVPSTQSLINGDFTILPNPLANVTGDGWDETTIWNFNLAADPNYASFIQQGTLTAAALSITLTTGYPNGPITDGVHPDGPFVTIGIPQFLPGPGTGSINFDLLSYWNGTDFLSFIAAHNGVLPMVYGDDAIVSHAEIRLTSAPAPAGAMVLGGAGLALISRRRMRRGQ